MGTAELLFELLRAEVNGSCIDPEPYRDYDPKALYQLAKAHDLMYCVTDALQKVSLLPQEPKLHEIYVQEQLAAAMRTVRIEDALQRIRKILNDAKVSFIPLKGARIRTMYPDKLMRASCDVDVLVKKEQLDQAISALVQQGFATDRKQNFHDISLYYGGVHLELHFSICEHMEDIDPLLERVWEYAVPVSQYEYYEKPEFFLFHHLAHMKYHFVSGGCGIRTFLDLYILRKCGFYEESKLNDLLDTVGLRPFYEAVLQMISVWFEGKHYTELTKKCESYILCGGAYGTSENNLAVNSSLRKGRLGNAWHSIFPKYDSMFQLYPSLKDRKYLLPLYYVIRVFDKTFKKSEKNSRKKLKRILIQDQARINSAGELLDAMGLKNEK